MSPCHLVAEEEDLVDKALRKQKNLSSGIFRCKLLDGAVYGMLQK